MKNVRLIIAIIILLCLCITGCTDSSTTNTSDYSDAIGDSPEAAVSPSESYIIESLNQSEFILEIEAATETNDPNGKLNADGGYTACVFFSSTLIDQSDFSEKSVIAKGTSCGGCIEVYSNEEDATTRNEYLGQFDGGILDSGSHTIMGTIVIRTSEKLTKEQQTELTKNLISIITSSGQPTKPNDQGNNEITSNSNHIPSEATTPPTEATTMPITEPSHTHKYKAATCTKPKICSCGATEGEANGHSWKAATCKAPKMCKTCGETTGGIADHNWKSATCETPRTCKTCKKTEGAVKGHDWKDATCKAPKTCKSCGETTGNRSSHKYENGKCSYCGKTNSTAPTNKPSSSTNDGDPDNDDTSGKTVYVTPTGKRYHIDPNCGGKNSKKTSLTNAKKAGLTPCKTCTK